MADIRNNKASGKANEPKTDTTPSETGMPPGASDAPGTPPESGTDPNAGPPEGTPPEGNDPATGTPPEGSSEGSGEGEGEPSNVFTKTERDELLKSIFDTKQPEQDLQKVFHQELESRLKQPKTPSGLPHDHELHEQVKELYGPDAIVLLVSGSSVTIRAKDKTFTTTIE